MKNIYLTILLAILSFSAFSQAPSNDDCTGAIDIGTLSTPANCPSGVGTVTTFSGTNVNATAPNPYVYIADCQGGNPDQANPASDVWYSVTATGNALTIDITGGTLTNPSIALWSGDCSGLTARGCANSGDLPVTFDQTFPGETYYIQISGDNSPSEGTFDLEISNSNDCDQCNTTTSLTVDPQPVNGTYTAGTAVNFCYTISEYDQVNTNWMHGLSIENMGPGWDGTITNVVTADACQGNYGEWVYYDGTTQPCNGGSAVTIPGWYFDVFSSQSTSPCDNFGDPGVSENGGGCALTFCFTLTTDPIGSCVPGASLSVDFNTWADGETGNWSNIACVDDPNYEFIAALACCEDPVPSGIAPELCFGTGDGDATITAGSPDGPFVYQWYGPGGSIDFTTDPGGAFDTQTTLSSGIYTVVVTDGNGCQASEEVEITASSAPSVAIPGNDAVCENSDLTLSDFVVNPVTGIFDWTSDVDIGFGTAGNTQLGTFTAVNGTGSVVTANITVTPTDGACPGPPETFTVLVNPAPSITAPGSSVCDPTAGFTIGTTFTPVPTSSELSFSDTGITVISSKQGSSGGTGTGVASATVEDITPLVYLSGQLKSVCFTVRAECVTDITALSIIVDGVTYSNSNNTVIADILTAIHLSDNSIASEYCLPQDFLTMIENLGGDPNSTWDLSITDGVANGCGGGRATADINDFTVVVENHPEFTYSWSGDCTVTSGSTAGTSTVGSIPDILAEYVLDGSCTLNLIISDAANCSSTHAVQLADICVLSADNIDFSVQKENDFNVLKWYVFDNKSISSFNLERKINKDIWVTLDEVLISNSLGYIYNDKSFGEGDNYYRIRVNNLDKSFDYTGVRVVSNESQAKIIKGIYNVLGREVELNTKGLIIIFYEDGTSEKVYNSEE